MNTAVNQALVEHVRQIARDQDARTFLDLYCGSGNFALPLLADGLEGEGVESVEEAIVLARRGADELGVPGQFTAASAASVARRHVEEGKRFDVVIVDPPRAGASELVAYLPALMQRCLVMVSCDPVTLARDLKQLAAHGIRPETIFAYDMFPHTHHVETLAVLTRDPTFQPASVNHNG